jgi:hypothetical protein
MNGGIDYEGRTLKDVHAFNSTQLEDLHDYIQWIFPLNEESRAVPGSPVLTEEDIKELLNSPKVEGRLFKSFVMMCRFYGFKDTTPDYNLVEVSVDPYSPEFKLTASNWLTPYNHNYLRLTRILKSLKLLGCDDWANELFNALQIVYDANSKIIGERTYKFWCEAVNVVG